MITIIGLGAGDLEQLPLGVYRLLKNTKIVYVRTIEHPVVKELQAEGVAFHSFDAIYQKYEQFQDVYAEIMKQLLQKAKLEDIVYAVPGHPMVAEQTVKDLLSSGEPVKIAGGQSFLDALFTAVEIDPIEGFQFLDGTKLLSDEIQTRQHMIVSQVYDAFVASEVKLTLMEKYPDDHEIAIVNDVGMVTQIVKRVPLYQLDHEISLSNLTSIYVPPAKEYNREFWHLKEIFTILRGPEGCPWDRAQTHETLIKNLIEETYEFVEAVHVGELDAMIEELGDVLLQVMLHAQIGEDTGYFNVYDVIQALADKMIRRHPHVFGDVQVATAEEALNRFQQAKQLEKKDQSTLVLDKINQSAPQLLQALEIQKAVAKVGFDWEEIALAWKKVSEEIEEFKAEWQAEEMNHTKLQEEFGDLLFALVNVARHLKINPEEAMLRTNNKFRKRFQLVEKWVDDSKRDWHDYTLADLDLLWEQAKKTE